VISEASIGAEGNKFSAMVSIREPGQRLQFGRDILNQRSGDTTGEISTTDRAAEGNNAILTDGKIQASAADNRAKKFKVGRQVLQLARSA
jgi:hypothetical protein